MQVIPERSTSGFTLIEIAIILVIIGLVVGMGAGLMGPMVKRAKHTEAKEIVEDAQDALFGYAVGNGYLPEESSLNPFGVAGARSKDAWNKKLVYIAADNLEGNTRHVCNESATGLIVKVCPDKSCSSPTSTLANVAFVIVSGGENFNVQSGLRSGVIKIYSVGIKKIDDYRKDIKRAEAYDDLAAYASLDDISSQAGCKGVLSVTSPTILEDGVEDSAYSYTLQASGGVQPYKWSSWSGSGLTLNEATGEITGTVNKYSSTSTGELRKCSETIKVKTTLSDSSTSADTYDRPYTATITVKPKQVEIINSSLPDAIEETSYNATISAAAGKIPYSWKMSVSPSCPKGLKCSGKRIKGKPRKGAAGTYTVTVTVNPSESGNCTATKVLGLTVNPKSGGSGSSSGGGSGSGSGGSVSSGSGGSVGVGGSSSLSNGLVGYWRFEKNFNDSSGNGNNGTQKGGVAFKKGKLGKAARFDGRNDSIKLPGSSSLNITGDITVSAWVKPNNRTRRGGGIIHKGAHYSIFRWSSKKITWADSSKWCYRCFGYYGSVDNNKWTHLIATKEGSTVTLYVNGSVLVTKSFGTSLKTNSSIAHIGCYAGNSRGTRCTGYYFSGLIDEAAIWNRALSTDEISELYGGGKGKIIK